MDETTASIKRQRFTTTIGTVISSSPNNSPLSTLPFHLLEEILCRFPVKFLLQLQCVSKSWKSLISDNPNFAKKHLQMSLSGLHQNNHHLIVNSANSMNSLCWDLPNPSIYLDSSNRSLYWDLPISSVFNAASKIIIRQTKRRRLPILNMTHNNGVVGSCHGIICVPILQHCILFWNPSIGKFKLSPIFEHARFFGFGYDDLNDKYKVVALHCYVDESVSKGDDEDLIKAEVMVHTLGTNCWRKIQDFPCGRGLPTEKPSKFFAGSVHWVTSKDEDEYNNSLFFVVSLDLPSESYQEILQPDYGEVNVFDLTLGVSRDCLCIFAHTEKYFDVWGMKEKYVDVWCMKEYGKKESWSKLFSIPLTTNLHFSHHMEVVYIYEDEQVLLMFTQVYKPELVVYDSKSQTFRHPVIENLDDRMVPIDYVESLVTPCSL
ncbi:hypothetical protein TSUD_117550 [Trifolium subterraneum]|nr:hypothetical protein TSUD_117550 [Trifolium subterraneum]